MNPNVKYICLFVNIVSDISSLTVTVQDKYDAPAWNSTTTNHFTDLHLLPGQPMIAPSSDLGHQSLICQVFVHIDTDPSFGYMTVLNDSTCVYLYLKQGTQHQFVRAVEKVHLQIGIRTQGPSDTTY